MILASFDPIASFFDDKFVIFAIVTCDCCEFAIDLAK